MWRQISNLETAGSHQNGKRRRTSKVDLFSSRLSHQLPQYFAWKSDPFSQGTDVLQQIWGNQFLYASHPFCLTLQALKRVSCDQTEIILLVTPPWQSQIWYPLSTRNVCSSSTATSKEHKLKKPTSGSSSSNFNRTLPLAVWTISGKDYSRREFQKQLLKLLQVQDEKVQSQITIPPGECGVAGAINNRLMHLDVMQ